MNQKLDTSLALSLSLSPEQRQQSPLLGTGYEASRQLWRLIMLYQGSLDSIEEALSASIIPLFGSFAIITIPEVEIPLLLSYPQVLYLELPGPLYQEKITGIDASCFSSESITPSSDFSTGGGGAGTLIGILDSGVDFRHPDFCTESGRSRILFYWDQSLPYDGVNRYGLGRIFTNEELNRLLDGTAPPDAPSPAPDASGHGTHIAGICAGNGRASGGRNRGAAPAASLLVVRLQNDASSVFTDYANLMLAADFAVETGDRLSMPLAVNISYGSNDGAHNGSSLVERFLSESIFYGKNVIVAATGNEGLTRRHSRISVAPGGQEDVVFRIGPGEQSMYLQLWKPYRDRLHCTLVFPGFAEPLSLPRQTGIYHFSTSSVDVSLLISEPSPYQHLQEIFFVFLPLAGRELPAGQWTLRIDSEDERESTARLWLPSREATGTATGFLNPEVSGTLTIPSTADNLISVSGYDSTTDVFAAFSGRGFADVQPVRPDLCAPAVNILSTSPGGGYSIRTGTSMAAPFVTGAAALLMEYGIVEGRDPFLYGEKIKALLQKGARPLPAFTDYPNPEVGWGALCVRESWP